MSIARDEAERLYPIHRAGNDRAGFIQPAIDVLSQNAYAKGRTADPCREQVEAVARILFEESWTYRPAPISFDEFKAMSKDKYTDERIEKFRRRARMLLDAARKAVM